MISFDDWQPMSTACHPVSTMPSRVRGRSPLALYSPSGVRGRSPPNPLLTQRVGREAGDGQHQPRPAGYGGAGGARVVGGEEVVVVVGERRVVEDDEQEADEGEDVGGEPSGVELKHPAPPSTLTTRQLAAAQQAK